MSIGESQSVQNVVRSTTQLIDFINQTASAVVKPKGAKGLAGFVFDVPTGEKLDLQSEITDHVVESGSFISDHVVDKPIRITLSGFVGELVAEAPQGLELLSEFAQNRLGVVDGYLGQYTDGMAGKIAGGIGKAQQAVQAIGTAVKRTGNLVNSLIGGPGGDATQQKVAYITLKAMKDSRQLLSVSTPWSYHEDMMIEGLGFSQDAESNDISDIQITLKQVRLADTKVTRFDNTLLPARVDVQSAQDADLGQVQGKQSSASALRQITNKTGFTRVGAGG